MDVNRARSSGRVIRARCLWGEPLQEIPDAAGRDFRLRRCYDPYVESLADMTNRGLLQLENPVHLSLHTFPSVDWHWPGRKGMPFEVEIGDLDRRSSPVRGRLMVDALTAVGFHVGYNQTFRGGEIVRRLHTQAGEQMDVIQIEVRRDLYLDGDLHWNAERATGTQERLLAALGAVFPEFAGAA